MIALVPRSRLRKYLDYHGVRERERQVLELYLNNSSHDEIGDVLGIAPGTVAKHLTNVVRQLDVDGLNHMLITLLHVQAKQNKQEFET